MTAIAIEDLDFADEKTREKHGRRKRFRRLISGIPTRKLKARLTSMAQAAGIAIIAVDPAYTSRWGAQHWQHPLTSPKRKISRHDAAAVAIARRAQQHPIRRRMPPPPRDQSDRAGHRSVQAEPRAAGREETRHRISDRAHDAPCPDTARTRATSTPNTVRGAPVQLTFTDQERFQPPFSEGHAEAMEFASGLLSLIGVAADYREP